MPAKLDFLSDLTSSSVSTIVCSIVSTPQMVITDRLMAGVYPTFPAALRKILKKDGLLGFYTGWWPSLAQKIPSYSITWMFFQQSKLAYKRIMGKSASNEVSFFLGAAAAAAGVAVMIPMDTVKTRLVIQNAASSKAYLGVRDCFIRIFKEEGIGAFYRSLPPRLASVVPMTAIQFGAYEIIKGYFLKQRSKSRVAKLKILENRDYSSK